MHGTKAQRNKLNRVLQTETLETRTVMASDLATAFQAFMTGGNRQDTNVSAQLSTRVNSGATASTGLPAGTVGSFNLGSNTQGNASFNLGQTDLRASTNRFAPGTHTENPFGSSAAGQDAWRRLASLAGSLGSNSRFNTQTGGVSAVNNAGVDATLNSRPNSFNLIAERIATGQRSFADRVGAARTLGSNVSAGSDVNFRFGNSSTSLDNGFNLVANRISTGTRALVDRVTSPRTLASSVNSDVNVGNDVSLRARDSVFGSEFATNLSSRLAAQNSLSANNNQSLNSFSFTGRRFLGSHPSDGIQILNPSRPIENPEAVDRFFMSIA